jgi:phosphoglycerate dehydrogenase-like enzyme
VRLVCILDEARRSLYEALLPLPAGMEGTWVRERDRGAVEEALGQAEVVVCRRFPAWMGRLAPRLRWLFVYGGGVDEVDAQALAPGVSVCDVGGSEVAVAEHAVALLLALAKNLSLAERAARRGCRLPGDAGLPPAVELSGRTVGILGFGRVGREVARRLAPFECDLLALRRAPDGYLKELFGLMELGGPSFLPTLLQASDFLVVAMPLTPETKGLLGRQELAMVRPGAFLVNVSRPAVVDEDALFEALTTGRLKGAALDGTYYEADMDGSPTAHRALERLGNVLLTPRMGGYSDQALRRTVEALREDLKALSQGEEPPGLVYRSPAGNPAAGSG